MADDGDGDLDGDDDDEDMISEREVPVSHRLAAFVDDKVCFLMMGFFKAPNGWLTLWLRFKVILHWSTKKGLVGSLYTAMGT